jgi:hypothetical protein
MTAPGRAPPSLGGKRHAAMAGSHSPHARDWAGSSHVKGTVLRDVHGRRRVQALRQPDHIFVNSPWHIPSLRVLFAPDALMHAVHMCAVGAADELLLIVEAFSVGAVASPRSR